MSELIQIGTKTPAKYLNSVYSQDVYDHFPFGEVREAQRIGLEAGKRLYSEGKKFLIIEAPTGSGKSGIGVALASWAKTQITPMVWNGEPTFCPPRKPSPLST